MVNVDPLQGEIWWAETHDKRRPVLGVPRTVAAFDNLQPIRTSMLTSRVGELSINQSGEVCRALAAWRIAS
jgi:mRNA-degrading endonuclease toxin of MazEF toxin-antitoxin module